MASLVILLQSNNTLAESPPKTLFCPEKIECSKDKSISSCKAIGEHLEYWSKALSIGTVIKGTYFFDQVYSIYQTPYLPIGASNSVCSYVNVDYPNITLKTAIREFDKAVFWEAAPNNTTKWIIDGFQAQCNNDSSSIINPKACPLELLPLIKIRTAYRTQISAHANGILLQNSQINRGDDFSWTAINMYQAWDACSDTGLCTIELTLNIYQTRVDVGNIIVDMDNKMEIVHVHAITGFEISHGEQENTIEIKAIS